ncbi:MAG: GAF domain-containing protein, partial [Gammaproteobacteria bacterium]|nr:GAF domain-containing protein [Gammaproteobacteria bacterium]
MTAEKPREVDYNLLRKQAQALLSGQSHRIANAANLSALIYQEVPDLNWAGFYFLENESLILGPFQGKPACVSIPVGSGVCGT